MDAGWWGRILLGRTLERRREQDDSGGAGGILELQEGRAGAEELGRVPGGGCGAEGGRKNKKQLVSKIYELGGKSLVRQKHFSGLGYGYYHSNGKNVSARSVGSGGFL